MKKYKNLKQDRNIYYQRFISKTHCVLVNRLLSGCKEILQEMFWKSSFPGNIENWSL